MPTRARHGASVLFLFALLGAIAGYALYRFVGCPNGGCPITGSPWISTAYGSLVGVIVGKGLSHSDR